MPNVFFDHAKECCSGSKDDNPAIDGLGTEFSKYITADG
jgi:hypothetical protein